MILKAALDSFCRRQFLHGLVGAGGALSAFFRSGGAYVRSLAGNMISRDHPDYETRRKSLVWQVAKPARRPDLIVQANSVDDVVAAVNHTRAQGLKLIAKSGGHSISGSFLRDDGMLLDLLGMREVEVAPVIAMLSVVIPANAE